jgi:hypothetical protein
MDADRQAEIARLREAVQQARALYEDAKREVERSKELRSDLGASNPDGHLDRALRIQTYSMKNYLEALVAYNHYLLDRKPPDF